MKMRLTGLGVAAAIVVLVMAQLAVWVVPYHWLWPTLARTLLSVCAM